MTVDVAGYLAEVQRLHARGQTTEHSFRPALAKLFDSIAPDVTCINEPQQTTRIGRPDFVMLRSAGKKADITVGHCEAKDIGLDVNPKAMRDANKAQFERYVKALPNLIYTNGLDFDFYKKGELVRRISIADFLMGIQPKADQFDVLANQLKDFAAERLQTITSAETLAEMMAGKAVLIKDILFNTLKEDADLTSELAGQFKAFKDQLIHDLSPEEFADIYAETIAYGMFAARLHDETLETFTRDEALNLLPKSNPFLRKLFEFVAGPSLPEGIKKTVDELAEVFQATDLQKLFKDFGHFTQRNDPFIHFYETFLAKYNPAKRKARGVWYTPEPVVNFIVRAVDDVLKTEFGLSQGLADTSKITVDWDTGQRKMNKDGSLAKSGDNLVEKREVHRVQILDPAAGTGTFLAEVIRQIGERVQGVAPGQWSTYVEKELIPRLHGFELLMASYAMCHMKLDMMLTSMGYKPSDNPPRLGVYLTNSLEEGERVNQTLPFAQWLSNEAKQANTVKNDVPVMVVIGNPPYSGISQNMGDWIVNLIEDYKYVDGKHFGERKHWLHDDYVKFIRFAEHMIEKNGEGVLGFITNHGYLDNPTFRGMRWHLLKTFDKIWILDLHGNTKKLETSPDGAPDNNVFDIQQGVAIIVAAKIKNRREDIKIGSIWHADIWGARGEKYNKLINGIDIYDFSKVETSSINLPFKHINSESEHIYSSGFLLNSLFIVGTMGLQTSRDSFAIADNAELLRRRLNKFSDPSRTDIEVRSEFFGRKKAGKYLPGDSRGWKLENARKKVRDNFRPELIIPLYYRPFDIRATYFSRDVVDWPREKILRQFTSGENISMLFPRQLAALPYNHIFITKYIPEMCVISNRTKEQNAVFPLYLYPAEADLDQSRRVNMDPKIRRAIEDKAEDATHGRPDEVAIFDYIYGVLHCPAYRDTYREFLKIDFPRIPYPPSPEVFWDISSKGTELRRLHLMEDAAIGDTPFPFTGDGDSVVGKVNFENGAVFINDTQSFQNVPQIAWEFYIGGYQPAQKWLKDRKGRTLSFDDILHYRKIIKILSETDRIMKTIDMPLE